MRREANDRQVRILAYIRQHIHDKSYAPSTRQIARALDIRSAAIVGRDLVDHLAQTGTIGRDSRVARGIRLLDPPDPNASEALGYLRTIVVTWHELRAELEKDDPTWTMTVSITNMDRLVAMVEDFAHERTGQPSEPV